MKLRFLLPALLPGLLCGAAEPAAKLLAAARSDAAAELVRRGAAIRTELTAFAVRSELQPRSSPG